jgi:predicted NAD-dependent protein-ADP-ribosyltransferase YbiA (DUF1768 family)
LFPLDFTPKYIFLIILSITKKQFSLFFLQFTQDDKMKQALLKYRGHLLVEAADEDLIWGVGLRKNNPLIKNRSNWKGLNLLGYILTDILQRIQD